MVSGTSTPYSFKITKNFNRKDREGLPQRPSPRVVKLTACILVLMVSPSLGFQGSIPDRVDVEN